MSDIRDAMVEGRIATCARQVQEAKAQESHWSERARQATRLSTENVYYRRAAIYRKRARAAQRRLDELLDEEVFDGPD